MTRLLVLIPLLLPVGRVSAFQQASPAVDAAANQSEPLVPKRQIEFETSGEDVAMPLFEADPKLLERRFMAEVKLSVPDHSQLTFGPFDQTTSGKRLVMLYLSIPPLRVGDFPAFLSRLPKDMLPSDELLNQLAADAPFILIRRAQSIEQQNVMTYRILAATPERTKELTHALLALLDHGIIEPIQEHLKELKEGAEKELAERRANLPAAQKELQALEEQLKHAEVLDTQTMNDLKTQRRLLQVDLAGVKARVAACEQLLGARLTDSRKEQVENIKIAAEIELAGLAARQKTIDAIIGEGQRVHELRDQRQRAVAKVNSLQQTIRSAEQTIADYTQTIQTYGPFRLVDDKVVIRPIKWEAKPTEKVTRP
jgi:hypothetical protein